MKHNQSEGNIHTHTVKGNQEGAMVPLGGQNSLCFQLYPPTVSLNKQLLIHKAKQIRHSNLNSKNHSLVYMSFFPHRLTQLRMDRENAESRVREMEDHLAELQDELKRDNGNKTVKQKHTGTHREINYLNPPLDYSKIAS